MLHVVLSSSTFRHALPSEDVLSWLGPHPPFIPSFNEAEYFTSTAAFFGCKYTQSALYSRFSTSSAQLAATCPHIRRSFLIPRSFLTSHSFNLQRTTLLHHHDTFLSPLATSFRASQYCVFISPLILTMTAITRLLTHFVIIRVFQTASWVRLAIDIHPRPTNGISVALESSRSDMSS